MMDFETNYDKLLQVNTCGRDDTNADACHHPYEPTPYRVLEWLEASLLLQEGDTLLDYGCGKGRVGFFLSKRANIKVIGIEYDENILKTALENQKISKIPTEFVLTRAEEYQVPPEVSHCYFFNPFSLEILHKVLARILESWYENPRQINLFFYYPADEYISFLMTIDELDFFDEIDCQDLFPGNDPRERVLIFQLPEY